MMMMMMMSLSNTSNPFISSLCHPSASLNFPLLYFTTSRMCGSKVGIETRLHSPPPLSSQTRTIIIIIEKLQLLLVEYEFLTCCS
jgi:hypothetical protein